MSIDKEIDALARVRADEWAKGRRRDPELLASISEQLSSMWEKKREAGASNTHGTRADIARKARVDLELERIADF